MDKNLVSVIVPVYNVENYLDRCVKSILEQTYQNLEIILIDDGSTDESGLICDKYKAIDDRIKVYHKSNAGQSCARNDGLDAATGQYILFVDADDYIAAEMVSKLLEPFSAAQDVSFTSCGYYNVFLDKAVTNRNSNQIFVLNKKEYENSLANNKEICFMVWNKLFPIEIIGDTRFIPNQVHEEIHFMREISKKVSKVLYIDTPLYYYIRERKGNTNSKFKIQQLQAIQEFAYFEEDMLREKNIEAANGFRIMQLEFIIDFYFKCKDLALYGECRKMKKQFDETFNKVHRELPQKKCAKYLLFSKVPILMKLALNIKTHIVSSKFLM